MLVVSQRGGESGQGVRNAVALVGAGQRAYPMTDAHHRMHGEKEPSELPSEAWRRLALDACTALASYALF